MSVRPCPYCEGNGCEECDKTGQRVRTHLDAGDGIWVSVTGSAPLSDEARSAVAEIARAAAERLEDDEPHR